MNPITVETIVRAPMAKVWQCWNDPLHIVRWAFAADTWEAPSAKNDLRVGGMFTTIMAAKDKSASFDFSGTYTLVEEHARIAYDMSDGRHVEIVFAETPDGVRVMETFDPEGENPEEMQRAGWHAILENFRAHVEGEDP